METVNASAPPFSSMPPLPGSTRIIPLLRAANFERATREAQVKVDCLDCTFEEAALMATVAAQRAVSHLRRPSMNEMRAALRRIAAFAEGCRMASEALQTAMGPASSEPSEISHWLHTSVDPMAAGLRDCTGISDDTGEVRWLDEALSGLLRLSRSLPELQGAFDAGFKREHASRRQTDALSPFLGLAFVMIDIYVIITHRTPARSRPSAGGPPTGPLVRFLASLFESACRNLATCPELSWMADRREWNPAPETLATWIREYRARAAHGEAKVMPGT